jgi:nicotinamide riboside kinase/pterin-4a-carbinolamine dehydratase
VSDPLLRAVLIGAEATGKTMLAQALARRFGAVWSPEFARTYVDAVRRRLTAADVEPIARGQIVTEDAAAARATRLLVLDTDLVSTCVYSHHYYGFCPAWIEQAARARLGHLYLLHHADTPWAEDGNQREAPDRRHELSARFRETLRRWGAPTVDVRGSWEEREATAVAAIDWLLAAGFEPERGTDIIPGGIPMATRLTDAEIAEQLGGLAGWQRRGDEIARQYAFSDFAAAMAFVNRVAALAESMDHHPDILVQYNKVTLTLSTHSAGGLTKRDFALARAVDS